MVVSLRWIVAFTLGLAAPAHAAGWSEPVTLPGAQAQISDRGALLRFDAAGRGVAEWSGGGSASISRTTDSAASWTTGVTPQFVPTKIAVGFDGAANRVYAYVASSNIRIVRTDPTGAPNAATFKNVPADARSVSLAVNPAGDVLVAWTSDNTTDETGIAFWAHEKTDPEAPQLLPKVAGASNATPFAALDPDRFAVVAYQQDGKLLQTQSANAGTTAFGPPSVLSAGAVGGMTGAQAPDGRAAISWYESRTITPNQYGSNKRFDFHASVRGIGKPFGGAQLVDGSDDLIAGYSGNNEVAISPTGRAIIGYATNRNRGTSLTCPETLGEQTTRVAVAQITATGEGSFAAQQLAGGGNVNSYEPRVAAGPDGRLAASWRSTVGCGNANTTSVAGAAFGAKDAPLSATAPGPPRFLGAPAFLPDGRLAALASTSPNSSGPLASIIFDPVVPVVAEPDPPVGDTRGRPRPSAPPASTGPAPVLIATPKPATATLGTVKAGKGGTLRLTVKTTGAGKLRLEAFAKKTRVGVATATAKASGTVTLTLKPTTAAKRRLRKARKLAVTLRLTFTPTGGKAGTPLTKKATLKA